MTQERRQAGFTLVELLMAVSILSIIIGVLGTALSVFLRQAYDNDRRSLRTGQAAVLASYLDRDLASAGEGSLFDDAGLACSGQADNVVTLKWYDFAASPANPEPTRAATPHVVAYALADDEQSAGRKQLVRHHCPAAGSPVRASVLRDVAPNEVTAALAPTDAADTCSGPGRSLTLRLAAHGLDQAVLNFEYAGCLKTRLSA